MAKNILVILAGYLLGSIPFAYLSTRLFTGKDIRCEGDGNSGARNVIHAAGLWPGMLTLALDFAKGTAACWLAKRLGSEVWVLYLTGFALMVGHAYPVWTGWRGGKGLASAGGFLLLLWPHAVLAGIAVLVAAQRVVRNFDLAFALAALTLLLLALALGSDLPSAVFIALLLGSAGIKRLLDRAYEQRVKEGACQTR